MKPFISRLAHFTRILAAFSGCLISIIAICFIWIVEPSIEKTIRDGSQAAQVTLLTTTDLLDIIQETLSTADSSIVLVETTLSDTGSMLSTSSEAMSRLSGTMQDQFVPVLENTRLALVSVQNSASVVDSTLRVLSYVPFIGPRYNPELPLGESIGQVAKSLEPVPESLDQMATDLEKTAANFDTLRSDIHNAKVNILGLKANLQQSKEIIDRYRSIMRDLQDKLDVYSQQSIQTMRIALIISTAFFAWLLFTQAGLLYQHSKSRRISQVTPTSTDSAMVP